MRKRLKNILAFLLAIVLAVSVTTGMALSAPAESESSPEATPSATAASDTDAAPTSPEDEVMSEEKEDTPQESAEAPVSAANEQTVTIGSGDHAVTVKTSAEAGVLPDGAKLVVQKLADTDGQYKTAADTLNANGVTYDDFLALDVGFVLDGEEVEPTGTVNVQFYLGTALHPSDADTDSLSVQHLENSGKVETVATPGSVVVQDQSVNAGFSVESFSTFTITWTGGNSASITTYFRLIVHYVDEAGNPIDVDQQNDSIGNDYGENEINLKERYAHDIEGYTYRDARFAAYDSEQIITDIEASETNSENGKTRVLTFLRDGETVVTLVRKNGDVTQTADIYLVYRVNTPVKPEPEYVKSVSDNGDGTYDLSLSVTGDTATTEQGDSISCSDVTITDTLTSKVQMVMSEDGTAPKKLAVTVTDASGNAVETPAGVSAHYADGQIVLDFPDDYELVEGYTYTVTTTIRPSEEAYDSYRVNNGTYSTADGGGTGDADTGTTSAGQEGFFTNASATLTFNNGVDEELQTREYNKPVIQVNPGSITINKVITGALSEDSLEALESGLTFTVTEEGSETPLATVPFAQFVDGGYSVLYLTPGKTYIVSETGADVDGYELTATPDNGSAAVTITAGAISEITFTNDYQLINPDPDPDPDPDQDPDTTSTNKDTSQQRTATKSTPKTGDGTNLVVLSCLMGISLVGLVGLTVVFYRNRRRS